MNKKKKRILARPIVQILFFVIVLLIAVSKSLKDAGIVIPFLPDASLHAVCPFGGVETFYQYIAGGTFIQKIHISALILMYAVLLLSLLFGPVFCGWVCPFGTFQEFIGKLGKKFFPKKYNHFIPQKFDRILRYLRYVVLALVLYNTYSTAKLIFQDVDPYYALFNMFTGEVAVSAYIVLFVIMVSSLFIERPFCKYMCPYGAMLGITNLFRIFKIKRSPKTCINCKMCDKSCPMNITVSSTKAVRDHQCISCLKCTSEGACPINNTVTLKAGGEKHED